MKQRKISVLMASVLLAGAGTTARASAKAPTPESVKAITKKVADWQIETFERQEKFRAIASDKKEKLDRYLKNPKIKISSYDKGFLYPWHDLDWHNGALYVGMDQWRTIADDPSAYTDFLKMIGERNGWQLHKRPYHADDHAVGQFYLSMYEDFNDPDMLKPTQERFDWILENPKTGTLEFEARPTAAHDRWGWCDALFMAPPVWVRLAKITGNQAYLDFMDQEYHATYDLLWNEEDHFFFRDTRYFVRHEENGKNLYWARGNGWVFGGLALMLPDLPADWAGRVFYEELFLEMAQSLKECQRDDGTWSMGLLGGTEGYPIKETSGTSFFVFGMAWGINAGILDHATYAPIVFKAWNALTECVTDEGLLGFVQPVGAAPGDSFADKTEVYGIGAFLAAGTEVYKLVGAAVPAVVSE
ncbi:glycoside hydrolase family 88 protein [Pontiellaceae bacterium B12219]|nr:glycoside hydrolase family 88 protein [Pontiellaceae bacterium B12219]